ncbi:hypothetical protein HR060_02805 [Catenovulum sp. SM1970]|uniref:hypothetical protein n=1 Tax=Marinifaba aquimaris TaxID=2741323 RepID=UPI0015734D93|nr:hypothetical protein [Marinifaba aquimaris]NTS75785.1 hypothetical protein [Marinifaba aquimaris]
MMLVFTLLTLLIVLGLLVLNFNGALTADPKFQILSTVLLIVGAVLCCQQYGVLRGSFIFLGMVTLVGTVLALLPWQFKQIKR